MKKKNKSRGKKKKFPVNIIHVISPIFGCMAKILTLLLLSQAFLGFFVSIFIGTIFGLTEGLWALSGMFFAFLPNFVFFSCLFFISNRNSSFNSPLVLVFLLLKPFLIAFFLYYFVSRFVKNQHVLFLPFFLCGFLSTLKGYFFVPISQKVLKSIY